MEVNLKKIKKLAKLKDNENYELMLFLKGCNHHQIDKLVHQLNEKYMREIDCTECGNCCEKLIPVLSLDETKEIANHLSLEFDVFEDRYIERKTAGGYTLKGNSCPFLIEKKCAVYDCRPEACRSFPHLDQDNINHRLINIIDNSSLCPIVFNVLEELKKQLWNQDNTS